MNDYIDLFIDEIVAEHIEANKIKRPRIVIDPIHLPDGLLDEIHEKEIPEPEYQPYQCDNVWWFDIDSPLKKTPKLHGKILKVYPDTCIVWHVFTGVTYEVPNHLLHKMINIF